MSQSLSKIGVQFIADMSDMVQKMNGMSAFTKNWAEKLATSMFSATPEQKQLSFVTNLRQAEINSRNEREQREREMAAVKQRLEEEHAARVQRNIEEAARHEIEVATRVAAERDNLYNLQQQKQRDLKARLIAEEMQATDNMMNEEEIRRVRLEAFKKRLQEEADQALERQQEDALDRELRLARLRAEAKQAVLGVRDPYQEDRHARDKAKADRAAEDAERARQAEEKRAAAISLSNKMQEEANTLVYRARSIQQRYADELGRLNGLLNHKNVLTGKSFLSDKNHAMLVTKLTIETIRQQQAQRELNREMIRSGQSYRGMTGAMTQLAFAAEDFTQVMSMSGNMGMALMSASNNLTMVAHSFITVGSTMSIVAGVGIPLLLTGIGMLARSFSSSSDAAQEFEKRLENIRNRSREDFALGMRERQRNFEAALKEQTSPSAIGKQIEESKRQQITLEENLAVTRAKARSEIDAQVLSVEKARKQIEQYYNFTNPRSAEDVRTQKKLREEGQNAVEQYRAAREELSKTNMSNAEDAQVALRRFQENIKGIRGLADLKAGIEKILSEPMKGSIESHNEIYKILKEIEQLESQRVEAQKRMNDLALQERIEREQTLKYSREEMLSQMRMTDVQKELFSIQKQMQEFVGGDPNNPNWMDQIQAQKDFLAAKKAELEKQMVDEIQQPPIAAAMQQNAFQAQADAMKQVLEAQYKRPDPQKEKILQVISSIDRAMQRGGIVIDVVP